VAVFSLTAAVGQRFYDDPKLGIGTPAPQTISAPTTVNIEDTEATQALRKAARRGALPMLMVDKQATKQITQDLNQRLTKGEVLRTIAGPFPFTQTFVLSTATQLYLRRAPETEWRITVDAVEKHQTWPSNQHQPAAAQKAIAELNAYRGYASSQNWSQLTDTIAKVRKQYQDALVKLSQSQSSYDASLLSLSDQTWQAAKQEIPQATQRILVQGLPPGLPEGVVKDTARVNVSSLAPTAQPLAMQILSGVLRPNLTIDLDATRQHAERVAKEVRPVILTVQKGEVIVREGEPISHEAFVLLDHFGLSRRGINWLGLIGLGTLVSGAVGIFWIIAIRANPRLSQQDYILVLLLTLSAPLLTWTLGISYNSLPAVGLLIGSFYGSVLGVTVVGLSTALLSVGINSGWIELLAITAGSLVAGVMAGRLRSREELALLGGGVALIQGIAYLVLISPTGLVWYGLLGGAALQSLIGLGWSVVALGISPYLERLFDLVTPIRLAELSNPNRPTLKRLALEAPGTFQHTLFVATLAEAAARALSCNVELVRAGALYHDIGKLHDPLSFIENQMGGPNKHDAINDPWQSAEIIKKHVTEGLVMARKSRLPKAIQAFIAEHHGTTQIAYFYYQAQKAEATPDKPVRESDFRYAGLIPQSKETAIVMLADSCEAALRSLKETSPEAALTLVNKIFKARWQDNQLTDSQLTRAELSQMANIFVQVWQQFNHKRIRYPSASPPIMPKVPNG
jgi:putative nucleotidyltransferase with HDIG domain